MRWLPPKARIVATIGYPGHGKTVFLASLFWDSLFTLSEAFHDEQQPYSVHALSDEASKVFFSNARTLNHLELPPPNPRTTPEPAILEFRGVPHVNPQWWQNRRQNIRLTFYDMAGELATSDQWLRQNAPFLPMSDDIIFLFDPTREDFNDSVAQAAELRDRIFERVAPQCKRRHCIVALSKIDELTDESHTHTDWGTEIVNRNWLDSSSSLENLPDYLRRMDELSHPDMLRRWWTNKAGKAALGFINGLPRQGKTHYCAISSLGHQPVWDCPHCTATGQPGTLQKCGVCGGERQGAKLRLSRKPEPFRVRDPLFWIFREAGVM